MRCLESRYKIAYLFWSRSSFEKNCLYVISLIDIFFFSSFPTLLSMRKLNISTSLTHIPKWQRQLLLLWRNQVTRASSHAHSLLFWFAHISQTHYLHILILLVIIITIVASHNKRHLLNYKFNKFRLCVGHYSTTKQRTRNSRHAVYCLD